MGAGDRHARCADGRRWLCGAMAVAVLGLAGCGSTAAPGKPAAGPTATGNAAATGPASAVLSAGHGVLCSAAAAVDRLTVSRVNQIPANHPHFSFPATVTVSDAARARSVAQALCALAPEPRGVLSCPADFGITYRLDFAVAGRTLPPVTIRASGCEEVSGAGLAKAIRRPAFWGVLGTAMRLAHPGNAAFTGTMSP